MPIILQALLISVGINALFFIFAAIIKTDVFTDITYSLTFIVLTISGFLLAGGFSSGLFSTITAALVLIWALRLGSYLFIRILKIKVDHRFDDRRDDPVKFGMFWALQSITVWLVMTPILILLGQGEVAPGALSWIGWGIAIIGLIIETVSDAQKYRFKSRKENRGRFMAEGLWKYSRHPNFFGEMLFWWGMTIPGLLRFNGWEYLLFIGPVFITFLLLKVSGIPLLEKSWEQKWGQDPEFQEYRRRTAILIPRPPRR
jgi:steroid 5-alpha reductase family enzyme